MALCFRSTAIQHECCGFISDMNDPGEGREMEGFADADGAVVPAGKAHVAIDGNGLLIPDVLQML